MDSRGQELIYKYLDGACSDEELAELRRAIEMHPEYAGALFRAAENQVTLTSVLREASPETDEHPRVIRPAAIRAAAAARRRRASSRRRISARRRKARAWLRYGVLPLAAAAAFLFMVHAYNRKTIADTQAALCAEIIEIQGEVRINTAQAKARDKVRPGQKLRTSPGGRVKVRYEDRSTLELKGDSRLLLRENASRTDLSKRYKLDCGELEADVAKQKAGHPMRIATPNAEAKVIGTRFMLRAETGSARLEVAEGRVRLTRLSDKKSVDVDGGYYAVATEGKALEVARIPGAEPPPAGIAVTSFTLINADTDKPIPAFDPLIDGAVLNLAKLPTRNLNVRANTSPAEVGSVTFALDGKIHNTEGGAPYALAQEETQREGEGYKAWTPPLGQHTLTATPYTGPSKGHDIPGSGSPGQALTIQFRIIDE